MTIDTKLAEQTRAALADAKAVTEIKMFGGIGFMLNGNMLAGASDRGLLVRVGPESEKAALSRPGAGPMIMRGRAMPGYIRVAPGALDARSVKSWIKLARAHVETLPAKRKKATAKPNARSRKSQTAKGR